MCGPVLHCDSHHRLLGSQTDELEATGSHKLQDDGRPCCVKRPNCEGEKEASIPRTVGVRGGASLEHPPLAPPAQLSLWPVPCVTCYGLANLPLLFCACGSI